MTRHEHHWKNGKETALHANVIRWFRRFNDGHYFSVGVSHREVSPARRVSPACRGISPVPIAVSPTPKTALPMPMAISPKPNSISPMRAGVNSGGQHKIPPLSPHRKLDRVVDSDVTITANGRSYVSKLCRLHEHLLDDKHGNYIIIIY